MFRLIAVLALCLPMVSGCSTTHSVAPPLPRPPIPLALTTGCPPLAPMRSASFPEVLAKLVEVSALYHDCRARHSALSSATRPVNE